MIEYMDEPAMGLIDAIHDNVAFSHEAAGRLGSIAGSLESLGMMPKVVAELDSIAEDMRRSADAIRKAHSVSLDASLRHNAGMTHSLLELALVVIPERAELAALKAEKKA
jgi:hypothetical protein